jgi:hypothetical protein
MRRNVPYLLILGDLVFQGAFQTHGFSLELLKRRHCSNSCGIQARYGLE